MVPGSIIRQRTTATVRGSASPSGEGFVRARRRAFVAERHERVGVTVRATPNIVSLASTHDYAVGERRLATDAPHSALERVIEPVRLFDQIERASLRLVVDTSDVFADDAERKQLRAADEQHREK